MRTTALFVMVLVSLTLNAQQWQWAKDLGDFDHGYPRGPLITSNEGGDLFSVAAEIGTTAPGNISTTRLMRLNPSGTILYADSIIGNHAIHSILADEENNFLVTGQFQYSLTVSDTMFVREGNGSSFLALFDQNGKRKWVFIIDKPEHFAVSGGSGSGYLLISWSGQLIKLNANGQLEWQQNFSVQTKDGRPYYFHGSYSDQQGNIYLWGGFQGDYLNINSKAYYNVQYGPWASSFIAKLSAAGNLLAVELLKAAWLQEVRQDENDNVYLKGLWDGDYSLHIREDSLTKTYGNCHTGAFFARIKPDNTCEWLKEVESDCNPYAGGQVYMMDVTRKGDVFIHGWVNGNTSFGQSTITLSEGTAIMKLDKNGDLVWTSQPTSWSGTTEAFQVAAGGNNAVYVVGAYTKDVTFGNISLSTSLPSSQVIALIADGKITALNEDIKNDPDVMIAPNPCDRTFTAIGGRANQVNAVYDQMGRQVKFVVDPTTNSVQLMDCEAGVYFVKLSSGDKSLIHKLIVR